MPSVKVPALFFKKERQQLYANWPVAFWRELVQNSCDAGAYTITIALEQRDDAVAVTFSDDGPGMSRSVMENVYFQLGETTKGGRLNVMRLGGFGRARILTCFSMRHYTIRTQDLLVVGDGADYTIAEAEPIGGCHLTIEIDDAPLQEMEAALRLFLRQSQLGCKVAVNGKAWTEWAVRGSAVMALTHNQTPFATVYTHPVGLTDHVIVRSKGIQTFFQTVRAPVQVVVEIEPSLLRVVLTGNRDSMQSVYQDIFDRFVADITLNASALHRRRDEEPLRVPTSCFTSQLGEPSVADDARAVQDIFAFCESDDQRVIKAATSFLPDAWSEQKRQTMLVWRIACDMTVEAMLQVTYMSQLEWSVGWYFGDPTRKAITRRKGRLCAFCLNPLDEVARFQFKPRDVVHQRRLLAIAKHEVSHAKFLSHDEYFATLYTEIDALVEQKEFYERVAAALDGQTLQVKKRKGLGPQHYKILKIVEEHAHEFGGWMTREHIMQFWPEAPNGSQNPVHSRLSELANDFTGEGLVAKSDLKVIGSAGRPVFQIQLTEAGQRRLRRIEQEEEKVGALTPEAAAHLHQVSQRSHPPRGLFLKVYKGILCAGPNGITIRRLANSDFGRGTGHDAHQMGRAPSELAKMDLIRPLNRDNLWVATFWESRSWSDPAG